MGHYEVELKLVSGHIVIVSNGPPGVFRVNPGDSLTFKTAHQLLNTLVILNIQGSVVTSFEWLRFGSFLSTSVWTPKAPGPYLLTSDEFKFIPSTLNLPESTIVVNPRNAQKLRMITLMPRRLGKLPDWDLTSWKDRGYNAFHFTPSQVLGPSGSSYSLANVLEVDPELLPDVHAPNAGWSLLRQTLKSQQVFSISDLVLNHASSENSWATKTPNATYCLKHCPYLRAALELDQILASVCTRGCGTECVGCPDCVALWMSKIVAVVAQFSFSEYFQLDVHATVELFHQRQQHSTHITDVYDVADPISQALGQVGISRYPSIVLDLRAHCLSISEVWQTIRTVAAALENAANECFHSVLTACESTLRYERIECGKIVRNSLLPRYFSRLENGDWAANNGWVMNWPAGKDFADAGNHLVYMKRHVVVWEDCLKLRYATIHTSEASVHACISTLTPHACVSTPNECVFTQSVVSAPNACVTTQCVSTLNSCISPQCVSTDVYTVMEEYATRIAQTFNGVRLDNCHSTPLEVLRRMISVMRSVNPDLVIVAELFTGSAMNEMAYEASLGVDLLVHEAMQVAQVGEFVSKLYGTANLHMYTPKCIQTGIRPQPNSVILYDATHDNSTVFSKFGNFTDALPLAALVCGAPCAIGSSVGFDELQTCMPSVVCALGRPDSQTHVTHNLPSVCLSGHLDESAMYVYGSWDGWKLGIELTKTSLGWECVNVPVVPGCVFKFTNGSGDWLTSHDFGVTASDPTNNVFHPCGTFLQVKRWLNEFHEKVGGNAFFAKFHQSHQILEIKRENWIFLIRFEWLHSSVSELFTLDIDSPFERIELAISMKCDCGELCVCSLLETHYPERICHWTPTDLGFWNINSHQIAFRCIPVSGCVVVKLRTSVDALVSQRSACPVDETVCLSKFLFGCDSEDCCYYVPNWGKLIFGGLAGICFAIEPLVNDGLAFLSSPIADHIRTGDWLFEYCHNRLSPKVQKWIDSHHYAATPAGLKPAKFADIFLEIYYAHVLPHASLEERLVLATYQFTVYNTVAAGLPHFAAGYMRCWGRDTFIAFSGLFLATKRYTLGRECILNFAKIVRHGLIPNLYDDGKNPRFNSRDAVWCFLNSVCNYIDCTNDWPLFSESVFLKYSSSSEITSFRNVFHHLLEAHLLGIDFVEWNAGPQIDEHMTEKGFHVQIHVDEKTGIIYGGNEFNCGTWMDKMGSSQHNKGIPATPRCGAAIEINGIALKVLDWVVKNSKKLKFENITLLTKWRNNLHANFYPSFYQNGLFIDTLDDKTSLRPNALFALAHVPIDSVNNDSVRDFLAKCEESLVGPIGMRTLRACDPKYNGIYDNDDQSRGYNYHNGPEWVWLFGYYLIACMRFGVFTKTDIHKKLENHFTHIRESPWHSLPELTNMNGQFCKFSCPSQAWSVACILEALVWTEK